MIESIFNILAALFVDLPKLFLTILVCGMIAYMVSLFVVGFPVSIWESVSKKKVNDGIESKIILVVAVCLAVAMLAFVLYKEVV